MKYVAFVSLTDIHSSRVFFQYFQKAAFDIKIGFITLF